MKVPRENINAIIFKEIYEDPRAKKKGVDSNPTTIAPGA